MPRQKCILTERFRGRFIRLRRGVPALHLQHIDVAVACHQVDEAAVQISTQISQLMLRVQ